MDAIPRCAAPSPGSDGAFDVAVASVSLDVSDACDEAGMAGFDPTGVSGVVVSTGLLAVGAMLTDFSAWPGCTTSTCVCLSPQVGSNGCIRCADAFSAWCATGVSSRNSDCFCSLTDASVGLGCTASTCVSTSPHVDLAGRGRPAGVGPTCVVADSLSFAWTTERSGESDWVGADWFELFFDAVGGGDDWLARGWFGVEVSDLVTASWYTGNFCVGGVLARVGVAGFNPAVSLPVRVRSDLAERVFFWLTEAVAVVDTRGGDGLGWAVSAVSVDDTSGLDSFVPFGPSSGPTEGLDFVVEGCDGGVPGFSESVLRDAESTEVAAVWVGGARLPGGSAASTCSSVSQDGDSLGSVEAGEFVGRNGFGSGDMGAMAFGMADGSPSTALSLGIEELPA